jgi:osmotically-inducible protein OsmY
MTKHRMILPLALVAAIASLRCSNTVEGLKKDAKENKIDEKTEKAAEKVTEAVEEAGREIKGKAQALEVKATLMADKRVDASEIKVRGDDEHKTLTLEGTVPTAHERDLAGTIAREKAPGYQVENRLSVAGR